MNMNTNLFWCVLGIIGGAVFSFLISLIFHFISMKRKRLNYSIHTFCIVSNKINQIKGLEVKYNSKEIENLYSSTITIKNVGNSIIEKQDVSPSCPFSIYTNGIFLLNEINDTSILSSNKTNNINTSFYSDKHNNECSNILFNFEYIAKKEIWTYTVLHTGDISFAGALKDGKIIRVTDSFYFDSFLQIISLLYKL